MAEASGRRRRKTAVPPGDGAHDKEALKAEGPAFRPLVTKINAIAKRSVRTGQYETYEISTMVEAERDPNFSVQHNISMINRLVTQEVNEMAEEIRKTVEVQS